jgi:hypothetical protein
MQRALRISSEMRGNFFRAEGWFFVMKKIAPAKARAMPAKYTATLELVP